MKHEQVLLLLASASPRRRRLIRQLGMNTRVIASRYQEISAAWRTGNAKDIAKRHALQKALQAVLPPRKQTQARPTLVLGADTIVVHRGKILGKPKNRRHARGMLRELSGKTHRVITAIALCDPATGKRLCDAAVSKVTFKPWDDARIDDYMKKVHVMDKAGAYALQESPRIAKRVQGSRTNVIGLPMELLRRKIRQALQWYR